MADIIKGLVIHIVDGDIFDIKVKSLGKENQDQYYDEERIRIADIDAPKLLSSAGKRTKELLERELKGKEVCCEVEGYDPYGRVIAKVKII